MQHAMDFYHGLFTEGSTTSEILRDTGIPRIRETVASFIHAKPTEIALVPNFSYALNTVVQSLKGTEKIMLYKHDYPSVYEPFRINKFDITWIDTKEDAFTISTDNIKEQLLQHKIDILVLSHVQWLSGFKADIAELGRFCKEQDIVFIVDATQSLGAIPIFMDQLHADVLIASNYKWMNAGFGTGIMYISEAFLQRYPPVTGGHNSYIMQGDEWKYIASAKSYEPGHLNLAGLLILEAAIKRKQEMGIEAIEAHNMLLTRILADRLADPEKLLLGPVSMEGRSSILVLKADKKLHTYLTDNNFTVTFRENSIRVSMHFYNTEDEVARLADCLNAYKSH